jgi:peroxiredoxin
MNSVRFGHSIRRFLPVLATSLLLLPLLKTAIADGPTDAPSGSPNNAPIDNPVATSQPMQNNSQDYQRPVQQIATEYNAVSQNLSKILPPGTLTDPAKRKTAAPHAIPLILQRANLIEELAATRHIQPIVIIQRRHENQSLLYLLGDQSTVNKVNSMIHSNDAPRQIEGQSIALSANWTAAGYDKSKGAAVIDQVEKLDRANPKDSRLTLMTMSMAQTAANPQLNHRLLQLLTQVMTDPLAARLRPQMLQQLKTEDDAFTAQKAELGKPLTFAGKTMDGDNFTTVNLKGKVILIDFWATWCPPCREQIATLQNLYQQLHPKGLEIVGISNDYSNDALIEFTTKNTIPWPQLFDAPSAANQKWNPLSAQHNIISLPTLFLLDRQGILQSVNPDELSDTVQKLLEQLPEQNH